MEMCVDLPITAWLHRLKPVLLGRAEARPYNIAPRLDDNYKPKSRAMIMR